MRTWVIRQSYMHVIVLLKSGNNDRHIYKINSNEKHILTIQ